MTTLASGVITKLMDGMKTGAHKPVGDHRTALLQVTDIVPVDLDEKALWPTHGFYIKLSDSTNSLYASLPADQSDLVMSNKIQLGQFINIDRLEPGLPVPVMVGTRPLPGRHPLVGTPDPVRVRASANGPVHRRGSWGPEIGPGLGPVRPTMLDFEEKTPAKENNNKNNKNNNINNSNNKMLRKSCVVSKFNTRSQSVIERGARIPKSPYPDEKSSVVSTPGPRTVITDKSSIVSTPGSRTVISDKSSTSSTPGPRTITWADSSSDENNNGIVMCRNKLSTQYENSNSPSKQGSGIRLSLPGKLGAIGKEAVQQRDMAQKAALQALRDASATDNVVRVLKLFSELSQTAKPESPSNCFEQFLSFHQETMQAVKDIETIQAATSISTNNESDESSNNINNSNILQEISQNGRKTPAKRRAPLPPPPQLPPASASSNALRLVREIQAEASNWFIEFLNSALESGLKKKGGGGGGVNGSGQIQKGNCGSSCPQSVLLRVVNWLETEQKGGDRKTVDRRVSQIARRLRIKAKNPN